MSRPPPRRTGAAPPRGAGAAAPPAATGSVRIIGGRLRGSKLPVADRPGLRPTADRVRETLFNWLGPALPGARVLDAFAGTGALGLEACSRGAAEVLMLERDPGLAAQLRASVERLKAADVQVEAVDALAWLRRPPARRFDLAFLDPPFADGLHAAALAALAPHLAPGAWVYVEAPLAAPVAPPAGWRVHREGATREVAYALWRSPGEDAATLGASSAPPVPGPQDPSHA